MSKFMKSFICDIIEHLILTAMICGLLYVGIEYGLSKL